MRSSILAQNTNVPKICIFCVSRLSRQTVRPAPQPSQQAQGRRITTSSNRAEPATAAAVRDEEDDEGAFELTQVLQRAETRKWGAFAPAQPSGTSQAPNRTKTMAHQRQNGLRTSLDVNVDPAQLMLGQQDVERQHTQGRPQQAQDRYPEAQAKHTQIKDVLKQPTSKQSLLQRLESQARRRSKGQPGQHADTADRFRKSEGNAVSVRFHAVKAEKLQGSMSQVDTQKSPEAQWAQLRRRKAQGINQGNSENRFQNDPQNVENRTLRNVQKEKRPRGDGFVGFQIRKYEIGDKEASNDRGPTIRWGSSALRNQQEGTPGDSLNQERQKDREVRISRKMSSPRNPESSSMMNLLADRKESELRQTSDVTALEQPTFTRKLSSRFVEQEETVGQSQRRDRVRQRYARREEFEDKDGDEARLEARREGKRRRKLQKEKAAAPTPIYLPPFISVNNLAGALKIRAEAFVAKMEDLGFEDVQQDHVLNAEDAGLIAAEYNFEPIIAKVEEDLQPQPTADDKSILPQRPPVVTVMGHVDHGKTTILDFLRKSSVAASEHGGITQHIGAFSVRLASGKLITFLDTPGHAAFLSMRRRGANVTDIVILVVAADDSVKPQTIEAIKHAKAAQVPIIVAINKIDKPEANAIQVRQDLARHGIEVEDYGGDVQAIEISGKTGQGMDNLEEATALLAEVLDIRAETDGPAEGWVLEGTTKKAGRTATVLVKRGTLRPGNIVVAGETWARVRTLRNEAGASIPEASPGTPVEVDGWRDQPIAGDMVLQAPSEQKATAVVSLREERAARSRLADDMSAINESRRLVDEERRLKDAAAATAASSSDSSSDPPTKNPLLQPSPPQHQTLHLLIKADVSGSAEAVTSSLLAIPTAPHPLSLSVLKSSVGPLSESDVEHLAAVPRGSGVAVAFNLPPMGQNIAQLAANAGVTVLEESIIYRLYDKVKETAEERLPPIVRSRVTGEAEVAQVFEVGVGGRKTAKVAGCRVRNGVVVKGGKARVWRGGVSDKEGGRMVFEGTVTSLKNVKKDVNEMRKGSECGIAFDDGQWQAFEAGDQVQCFEEVNEKRKLA